MLKKGLFITFEGTDGAGKTTQIERTHLYLAGKGIDILLTREPGGTRVSELIRGILLETEDTGMAYETEALLFAAARAQHVRDVIKPALSSGKTVICDRYVDSSLAYQGHARGLGIRRVEQINEIAVAGIMPDITFLLMLPLPVAAERKNRKGVLDRIEKAGDGFMASVYEGYEILAERFGKRIIRIDANGDADDVFESIRIELDKKIKY